MKIFISPLPINSKTSKIFTFFMLQLTHKFRFLLSTMCALLVAFTSHGQTCTPPAKPTGLTATAVSSSQINLKWNSVSGAIGYDVSYCDGTYIGFTSSTTYSSTGRVASTNYSYKVQAQKSATCVSGFTACASATTQSSCTPPAKPTGLTATAVSSSQINLSWNAVSGAIGYDVSYCDGTYIGFVSGTTYSHTGRVENTNYSYKVQAQKSATCVSGYTTCASATTQSSCTPPAKPTGFTANAVSSSQINLSWNAVSGANGYDVSYCDGTYIGFVSGTTYSHTGRAENTNYSYKVQAQKSATCVSGYTTCASATTQSSCTPPAKPTGFTAIALSSSQINLSWNAVSGANGYDVSYCDGTYIGFVSGTTYSHTGRVENTNYSYKVQAQKSATCVSGFTSCASATTLSSCTTPAKPIGLTATAVSSSQINLSWNAVSGAIGYDVSYCDGTYIGFVSGTTYSHTGRAENTNYSYKVQAQKSATCVSGYTTCASATTQSSCTPPAKPTGLTATAVSSSQINLSWNAVSGAIGYDVSYCDGTYIEFVSGTTYSHTGRSASTNYSYKVQAQKSETCVSGFTTCASATTQSSCTPPAKPTGLTATAISSSQINLSWNAVSGAIGYDVSYCDGTYIEYVSGTTYSHTGRVESTNYSYMVQAQKSATCVSGFTTCASATTQSSCTPPAKPTGLTATAVSSSQINLSWNAVSGAIGYDVSYCDGTYIGYTVNKTYQVTGLSTNTLYQFKINAQKVASCTSGFTTCFGATTQTSPVASITMTSPNGGESWEIGSSHNITWNSANFTGNVKVEINGNYFSGTWEVLYSSIPNDGSESWTVTGVAGTAKRIRVTSVNNASVTGISNSNFTLTDQSANSIIIWPSKSNIKWDITRGENTLPGPNNWSSSSSSVWVDPEDNLHLTVRKIGDKWYSTQIVRQDPLGYGEYTFQVSSNVENLDKNIVLGLYTYKSDHEEIDIEFSRWGSIFNNAGNFTVQPSSLNSAKSTKDFPLNLTGGYADSYSTHKFIWNPSEVDFLSYYGHDLPTPNNKIKDWQYDGTNIPTYNNEKVILNLYLYQGIILPNQQETEVVIKSFLFNPPSITITSANGGENWQIGSKQKITWNSTGITGNVNIEVNGNFPDGKWEPLLMNTSNEGSKSVVITGQEGNAKRIKITSVNNPQVSDISDGNFTYKSPLTVLAADVTDLGNRKPLLLIHGIQLNGIPSEPDRKLWFNFYDYYNQDQKLLNKFKIYYVWYYSNIVSVADLGYYLRLEIDKNTDFAGKQISIVAHSMGGLVSRAFMNKTVSGIKGGERVDKLITLGTPHHGSPMSNGPARYSALDPITATEIFSADQLLFSNNNPDSYQYNRSDLRWDNFDNLLNYDKYSEERNDWLEGNAMNGDRTYDKKIIAYAGSFDILDFDKTYSLTDLLIGNMFTWRFFRSEITDGIVPYCSATFEGHTLKKLPRFFKGYNHSRLPNGKGVMDNYLFGTIKADLLDESPVAILVTSPSQSAEYGDAVINSSIDKVFSLQNTGSSIVNINGLSIIGANSDQFKIISPTTTIFNIGIGETMETTVRFNPTSSGLKSANLQIPNNSENASPIKTIALSGTGIAKTFNAPTITTIAVTAIDLTGATCGGKNISDGGGTISAKGICWGSTTNPTISLPNSMTSEGTGIGTFSSRMTGLTAGSTYHVRAYATNAAGTGYSSDISFTTNTNIVIPSIITISISDLKITEASSGGKIISDGGGAVTSRGVCWSSVLNPTIANLKTSDGTGLGTFTSEISGLTAGTTYHVRSYATNNAGTAYGEDIVFTTNTGIVIPTISTINVFDIKISEAGSGGNIISDGGGTVISNGVCWSTSANPATTNAKTSDGTGVGPFSSRITGLTAGITYHVRAYATNSAGTAYGEDIVFITPLVAELPTLSTSSATVNSVAAATSGGSINSDGGANVTDRGVCWSTSANPTTANSKTWDGSGIGGYTSNITGLITGSIYHVRAYAINSAGTAYGQDISFTTPAATALPTLNTNTITATSSTSAESGGEITSEGGTTITSKGVCWNTGANPTIANLRTLDGTGPDSFTSNITGLSAGSTYHVRAYATNSTGTAYGQDITITTPTVAILPYLTTNVSIVNSVTTASSGGNITSDGGASITAKGVCWSTSTDPTTANSKTSDGIGTGTFTSNITGLTVASTYHVRAYAINSAGTAYGQDISFTTPSVMVVPALITTLTTASSTITASSGGNITSDGGAYVTAKGICWNTSTNPTTANSRTSDGVGTGIFSSNITGLTAGSTYHVRAYATNSAGTAYGQDITFTTPLVAILPTLSTNVTTATSTTTASSGGNIISDGGAPLIVKGVCWSTIVNPTIASSKTSDGTGTGTFLSNITGITAGLIYHVRAYATNSAGTAYGEDIVFMTPSAAIVPTITTVTSVASSATTASSGGNITSDGGATVTARGVCWSSSVNPTTNNLKTADGIGTGTFNSNITSLTNGSTYHVRAYATNSVGTAYGQDITFTTPTVMVVPTLTTSATASSSTTTATSGGNITSDGGSPVVVKGVCWNTSVNPTIANSKTLDGIGTGTFSSSILGLNAGTTYHVRAYATNTEGTGYGQDMTFKTPTLVIVPTLTTTSATAISATAATSGGNIISDGGATITTKGVCWSTSLNPTITNSKTLDGMGIGIFTSSISSLTAGSTYHSRAYATNSAGTGYGEDITFTTLPVPPIAPIVNSATSNVQTSFIANWSASAAATGYRLDVATNIEFTTFVSGYNDKDVSNVTTFGITGLSANILYYYRVRAYNTGGTSTYSSTITTTTLPNAPAAPTVNPATSLTQISFNTNWNSSATAIGYRLDVALNAGFTSFVAGLNDKDIGNITSFSVAGLSVHTQYYYRVRAYNTGGIGANSNATAVSTLSNPPAAPTGLTVSSCNNLVTLKWRKNSDPYFMRYRIYGGLTNNPTSKMDSSSVSISDTLKVISGLINGQTYYFRVTAVNNDGPESVFSSQSSAIVKSGVIPQIKAKWGDLLICYNLDNLISNYQWYKGSTLIPNAISQYYSTEKQAGTYLVETIDKDGCKNSSNTIQITSGTKSLTVYPNPVSVSFALRLTDTSELKSAAGESVTVSLINSSGQRVLELHARNANDELLKAIPVSNLVNGIYIVQILLNNTELHYVKIVVLK